MVFSCKKYSLILMSLLPFVFLTSGCGHKDDIFGPGRIDTNNRGKLGKVEAKSNDEIAERLRIMDQTSVAIKASDFATLNKMVSEYRVKRSLTPSGTWKLSRFYQRLNYHLQSDN